MRAGLSLTLTSRSLSIFLAVFLSACLSLSLSLCLPVSYRSPLSLALRVHVCARVLACVCLSTNKRERVEKFGVHRFDQSPSRRSQSPDRRTSESPTRGGTAPSHHGHARRDASPVRSGHGARRSSSPDISLRSSLPGTGARRPSSQHGTVLYASACVGWYGIFCGSACKRKTMRAHAYRYVEMEIVQKKTSKTCRIHVNFLGLIVWNGHQSRDCTHMETTSLS